MRISDRRSVCAIRDANRIRLARLSKSLPSFTKKSLLSFLILNPVTPISSFPIVLAVRFPLSSPFKRCIQLLRRGQRLIRKGGDITGMIHRSAYLCIFLHKLWWGCIRPAAPIRLDLAPHLPLAKTPADP
jgi:hypothetical protein